MKAALVYPGSFATFRSSERRCTPCLEMSATFAAKLHHVPRTATGAPSRESAP
jgi:hypothetical protein